MLSGRHLQKEDLTNAASCAILSTSSEPCEARETCGMGSVYKQDKRRIAASDRYRIPTGTKVPVRDPFLFLGKQEGADVRNGQLTCEASK